MPLVINTNVASLFAQRSLTNNTNALEKSVQRLSSGLRINTAADDAAGLAISDKLQAHIRSISVAIRNAQDGISLMQTAEGGLNEITNILTRMRELAEQASTETIESERSALNTEYGQLLSEIDRIANVTEFNGVKLLDGSKSASGVSLQIGFKNTTYDRIVILSGNEGGAITASAVGLNSTTSANAIATAEQARSALAVLDDAIASVARRRGIFGSVMNRLDSTISNLRISQENLSAANSRIRDADFAQETAIFTKNQILVQAATAVLAQANTLPQQALQLLR